MKTILSEFGEMFTDFLICGSLTAAVIAAGIIYAV